MSGEHKKLLNTYILDGQKYRNGEGEKKETKNNWIIKKNPEIYTPPPSVSDASVAWFTWLGSPLIVLTLLSHAWNLAHLVVCWLYWLRGNGFLGSGFVASWATDCTSFSTLSSLISRQARWISIPRELHVTTGVEWFAAGNLLNSSLTLTWAGEYERLSQTSHNRWQNNVWVMNEYKLSEDCTL